MRIFIGMETSGELRRRFTAIGHNTISCDILPPEDGAPTELLLRRHSGHAQGDVFETLDWLRRGGRAPHVAVFHPTCTLHTLSAAWAYSDPDFDRYPGVGYHQRVKLGTLTGRNRREARLTAEQELERIKALPFYKVIENPRGTIPSRTSYGAPADVVQPYEFGGDASKATCLWAFDPEGKPLSFKLPRNPALYVPPTLRANGKSYWANQTDTGQNRLSPGDNRWQERSRTYPGIADALVEYVVGCLNSNLTV